MRILIVCKANFEPSEINFQKHRAFIYDQVKSLEPYLDDIQVFFLRGKGFLGYFKSAIQLRKFLKETQFDLIHAHYGYSGLLASIVSDIPTVVTYHGTDITENFSNLISTFSILLADWNIFVSSKLRERSFFKPKHHFSIIPCGVDLGIFLPLNRAEAFLKIGWINDKKRILFSSFFDNPIKNVSLARESLKLLEKHDAELIELKNKTREEVALILNSCEVLLLTSHSEGSPQVIKEAMACNCPIVATDVGDIREVISDTNHCYTTRFDPKEIAQKLDLILQQNERSNGRERVLEFDNKKIAANVLEVYNKVLNR